MPRSSKVVLPESPASIVATAARQDAEPEAPATGNGAVFSSVGMPWAVQKLGALATFVALIGAQMVAGMVWDAWVQGAALTAPRVLGAAFAVAGVALTTWK